jgi:hypothetical protein
MTDAEARGRLGDLTERIDQLAAGAGAVDWMAVSKCALEIAGVAARSATAELRRLKAEAAARGRDDPSGTA